MNFDEQNRQLIGKKSRFVAIKSIAIVSFFAGALHTSVWAQPAADAQAIKRAAEQRTVSGILKLLEQTKPDPQRVEAYRAILAKPLPPADAFWFTKRDALLERMDAAESLGDLKTRLECADAIMAIFRERKDTVREMEFGMSYSFMLQEAGRHAEAHQIQEIVVRHPQTYAHWVMTYNNVRSNEFSARGDVAGAESYFNAAATEFRRHTSYTNMPNTASAFYMLNARYKRAQGKYSEAEANYQLALKETDRWVSSISSISNSAKHALPSTRGYSAYLSYRLDYVNFLRDQGRLLDAQRVALQPLMWSLERVGKYSPHAVRAAAGLASVLISQGRLIEGEQLARAAVEMAQGIGAAQDSVFMRAAHDALARALMAQERVPEADALFQALLRADPETMNPLQGMAAVLNGRSAQVIAMLENSAKLRSANLGDANPLTGEARGVYAMALHAQGQRDAALAQFKAAMPALLAARKQVGESEDMLRIKQRQWILEAYLQALGERASTDAQALAESFAIADLLRGSSTQQAVAASAARAAVNDPQLAATVRKEQDMRAELVGLYRSLQQVAGLSAEELKARGIDPAQLRARVDVLSREHEGLFADIEKRFPKYANLLDPKPPSIEQVRASLKGGEALVSILSTARSSFVWAVSSDKVAFHRSSLGEAQIAPLVKKLRASLDVGDLPATRWPDVDMAATHQLYKEFIEPVQAALAGVDTLIVAANNSLSSLPPAVLTTAPHTLAKDKALPFDRYTDVPWLDKSYATVQIPSVNALVSLRAVPAANAGRAPFTGFGDPVFASNSAASAANTRGLRSAAMLRPDEQMLRSQQASSFVPYSKLSPLPDTRDEVLALAKVLGADPARDVLLGAQATKAAVKQRDLSKSRVIAFATHGLLPGDFPGLSQPALALSPPPGKNADEQPLDALLTLEDVLGLKLDADWVVLSACNTAAADGQGSEAVSGLGRGFFYAGSRAMLVTHWAVDSDSARELVTQTFSHYAQQSNSTRAKALQRAMQTVRAAHATDGGKASYAWAHPLFWAPYALVGEPGR
jgi:CHAT domain-containing protein